MGRRTVSDSPHKTYARNRIRWIVLASLVTLCTSALGLLRDADLVQPTFYGLSLGAMIASWTVAALVWCTHSVIEEQRRRETRICHRVGRLLSEHNGAGWAAYAEQAENVHPINGRR